MNKETNDNDLQEIITQALNEIKKEQGNRIKIVYSAFVIFDDWAGCLSKGIDTEDYWDNW